MDFIIFLADMLLSTIKGQQPPRRPSEDQQPEIGEILQTMDAAISLAARRRTLESEQEHMISIIDASALAVAAKNQG